MFSDSVLLTSGMFKADPFPYGGIKVLPFFWKGKKYFKYPVNPV
jgi:hypothetical protein